MSKKHTLMRKQTIHYLAFSLVSIMSYGQEIFTTTDIKDFVALDYKIIPNSKDIQLEDKTVTVAFSSLLDKSAIGFGLNYTHNSIDFKDHSLYNDFSAFEELHTVQLYADYKQPLKQNWDLNVAFTPYISSTLNENISSNDLVLSYAVNFVKNWEKNGLKSYLKLGAGYGALFGAPNFYPLVSYSSQVNEKFRYEIGIPVSGAYYNFNDKSRMHIKAEPESIYANNASAFFLNNKDVLYNSKLEFKAVKLSLGYSFHLDSNWATYFNVGYLTNSELSVNNNDNKIYDFGSDEALTLNVGLRFNLNKK